jgi:iron complex outermembrane receptor protein
MACSESIHAQTQTPLSPVVIEGQQKATKRAPSAGAPQSTGQRRARRAPAPVPPTSAQAAPTQPGSLTVPTTEQARTEIERTPGGVAVVPDSAFKSGPANTIKDILGWVPGVLIQTRWGPDGRLSIRGSGLTRSYGNRGVNMYMDGIPINSSDGLFDLFEVDPTAYRYVEVFKGANALRLGANSLGGAVNFVTPTGRDASWFDARIDAGSFGYLKSAASSGGAFGPYDHYINVSAQREDGYREHNKSNVERLNANFGYQISPDAETRFYVDANSWRARLPGELTKAQALNTPQMANAAFVAQDQQRNIDSVRLANKTTLKFDDTTVEFGVSTHQRHVDHPIFRYLDFTVSDFGGFARVTDDRMIGGFRNRLVVGVNALAGVMDYQEYVNVGNATKGALARNELEKSQNHSAYVENSFFVLPNVALIAGGQFLHAVRNREDRFLADGDQTLSRTWDVFSPKAGVVWDVDRSWQVYGNISRSAEVPTYDSRMFTTFTAGPLPLVDAQTATTYEVGTRGRRPDFTWDVSLYRSDLRNELQCLTTSPFSPCVVVNADRTVHQGVEAGFGVAFLKSVFAQEDRFWFNLVYTYSDFRFDGDATWGNNRLPGAPPHSIRAEVLYRHPNGFYIGPNVEWMPQAFYADNANSLTVDPYALLNFKIGYDPGKGWSGYIEGRNLLDTRYIATTITAGKADPTMELFNPGTGRAIYAGLRYRM